MDLRSLRRRCAQRRGDYHQARFMYDEAILLGTLDVRALRAELSEALVLYYVAHSALHGALRLTGGEPDLRRALH